MKNNQLPLLLVAIAILLAFVGYEYTRRKPIDDAAKGLEEVLKKDKQIECDFLRKQQKWSEYDKKCS